MQIIVFALGAVLLLWLVSLLLNIAFALLIPLVIWMLAGMFAGRIVRGRGYGIVADVGLGLVGGIVGSAVLRVVGLGWLGDIWLVGSVLVGVLGAVLVVYLVRLFGRKDFAA